MPALKENAYMKLADVVPLTKPSRWTKKQTKEDQRACDALNIRNHFDNVDNLYEFADEDEAAALRGLQKRLSTNFNNLRADILLDKHSLPGTLWSDDGRDTLTKASKTPRIDLSEARAISDKLGFIITPFEYLDPRSYKDESKDTKRAIKAFDSRLSGYYNTYVIAPIHHYNIERHVRATSDLEIYAGGSCEQAFMAINMAVPVFRSIFLSLDQLKNQAEKTAERVNENTAAINSNAQEIKNLARRVNDLQRQVQEQREREIIEAARQERLRQELETLRSQNRFWAYEPMMLGVPRNATIKDDVPAIVGPCWGPDFEDIVVAALGLKEIKGQGEMLDEAALQWVDMGTQAKENGSYVPPFLADDSHSQ